MRHSKKRLKTVTIVLAGGAGGRMKELTHRRSKPVLPFGGTYRLIDIPLSNLHHSQLSDVWLVEQYRPHGLNEHLCNGRPWDLDRTRGGLVVMPPFEGKGEDGDGFASGNAEALNLQRQFLEQADPDLVLVLSADHVYRHDFRDLIDFHVGTGADMSLLYWKAPRGWKENLSRFSIVEAQGDKVTGFAYKPEKPSTRLVGTEVFLYSAEALLQTLKALEEELGDELGDYGEHLLPRLVEKGDVRGMELEGYWRDVGTVEAYWQAHQDLVAAEPEFKLEDSDWPILTDQPFRSPARIEASARIERSLISPSCLIEGKVTRSVIGPGCTVADSAEIEDCVLLDGCRVGPNARLRKAIVDSGSEVDEAFGDADEVRILSPDTSRQVKAGRTRRAMDS